MSISEAQKLLADRKIPQNFTEIKILIDTSLCPLGCQLCVASCPTNALYFFEVVHVQNELCVGCGACVSSCMYEKPIQITRVRRYDGKKEAFNSMKSFVKVTNAENARKRKRVFLNDISSNQF
ncbi:MAG: DUF362 domain-containing protein [Promethearchaeota archaeon]